MNHPNELDEKIQSRIKKYEDYIASCKEASNYAIGRFDILIISLSTGALGFSIAFLKDFVNPTNADGFILIKISWIFFATAIMMNLLSQKTSYYSHKIEIKLMNYKIKKLKGKEVCTNCENRLDLKTTLLNGLTIFFNLSSLILFVISVILTLIFICKNS